MEYIISLILLFIAQLFGLQTEVPVETGMPAVVVAEVVSVTDGDTIVVMIDGAKETVRYIGIDTPEPYRDGEPACYSKQATERNSALVAGSQVTLTADTEDRDRFDRLLRYVSVDGVMVNRLLVAEGYATTLTIKPNTQYAAEFAHLEAQAQTSRLGLWGSCFAEDGVPATVGTPVEPSSDIQIDTMQMTEGQRRLLTFLGIDADAFVVTENMITCANAAVGIDRLAEIIAGKLPSVSEGVALVRCYSVS